MKKFSLSLCLLWLHGLAWGQIPSANGASPLGTVLIDPSTGLQYMAGGSDANSILPIANFNSPTSVILIDPSTGLPYKAGSGSGTGTVNSGTSGQCAYYATTGTAVSGCTFGAGLALSGSTLAVSYSLRAVTSGTTDTVLSTDCANGVNYTSASAVAITLPQATGSFSACNVDVLNNSAVTETITPTTSTINGGATLSVGPGQSANITAGSGNYSATGPAVAANAGVSYILDEGTKFTISSGTGACATTSTLVGGTAVGSFKCTGTSGASTAVIALPTAPNGVWHCSADDETTTTDTMHQTTHGASSVTLSGTLVSNDVITFGPCAGS